MNFKQCDENVNEWLCTLMFVSVSIDFHDGVNTGGPDVVCDLHM